jgi:hypothetical protein
MNGCKIKAEHPTQREPTFAGELPPTSGSCGSAVIACLRMSAKGRAAAARRPIGTVGSLRPRCNSSAAPAVTCTTKRGPDRRVGQAFAAFWSLPLVAAMTLNHIMARSTPMVFHGFTGKASSSKMSVASRKKLVLRNYDLTDIASHAPGGWWPLGVPFG